MIKSSMNLKAQFQTDVYEYAAFLGNRFGCRYIIAVGIGNLRKLTELHPKFRIVVITKRAAIMKYRQRFPFIRWLEHNFEDQESWNLPKVVLKKAVILCTRVLERMADPSQLIVRLKEMMDVAPVGLLTAPKRDMPIVDGGGGQPVAMTQPGAWQMDDFAELLHLNRLNVEFIGLTKTYQSSPHRQTLLSILGNNMLDKSNLKNIKVAAILTAYNEEDIIYHSIKRLLDQQIYVYVIENWSRDSTAKILDNFKTNPYFIGYEKFPKRHADPYFNWNKLLKRVNFVASKIKADWYIHHDVDEIRVSPWPELNLREAIAYVDQMGYNVIDSTVIEFFPVNNAHYKRLDHEKTLSYFEFGKQPADFKQFKIWKNTGRPVQIARGGHQVYFEGRRDCPYKFLTKHYPFRSQKQAEKKVFIDRKPRWNPKERAKRMHIHYDVYKPGHRFVRKRTDLELYDSDEFNAKYLIERLSGIGLRRIPYRRKKRLAPKKVPAKRKGIAAKSRAKQLNRKSKRR